MRALIAALLLAAAPAAAESDSLIVIRKPASEPGKAWWEVRATDAPVTDLLELIGTKGGYAIEGLAKLDRSHLVTVDLVDRPLSIVLEYTLGSVGLRHEMRRKTIEVFPYTESLPPAETRIRASIAWVNATKRFPEHPLAPVARLAQGALAHSADNPEAALGHYQTLIDSYPLSNEVAEARMRSGRILTRLERWAEASQQYEEILRLPSAVAYHPMTRVEVARCRIALGHPQSALYVLESLDTTFPTQDPVEKSARLLVRAEALNAMERYADARRVLESAGPELDPVANREALKVLAVSFEGSKEYGEASRAWLSYSRDASPREKEYALRRAAELSLDANDEIPVLFICEEARRIPARKSFDDLELEARRRLGLAADESPKDKKATDRITLAESWLEQEEYGRASEILEQLYLARGALESEEEAARVCAGWAACMEQAKGLEQAIQLLAEARSGFDTVLARAILDRGAAALLEKHELYERAIEAYQGRY